VMTPFNLNSCCMHGFPGTQVASMEALVVQRRALLEELTARNAELKLRASTLQAMADASAANLEVLKAHEALQQLQLGPAPNSDAQDPQAGRPSTEGPITGGGDAASPAADDAGAADKTRVGVAVGSHTCAAVSGPGAEGGGEDGRAEAQLPRTASEVRARARAVVGQMAEFLMALPPESESGTRCG